MSLTDDILRFVNSRYFEPARLRGENQVVLVSGQVHSDMGLRSRMPNVCQALRSRQIEGYGATLKSEIRRPNVRLNSSTNQFVYLLSGDKQGLEELKPRMEPPRVRSDEPSSLKLTPSQFEEVCRVELSRRYNTHLSRGVIPGIPKTFDFLSPDHRVVGDAKYFTMVRGEGNPSAKLSVISEYVWLLDGVEAEHKFLVFGNDRRVPEAWLRKHRDMVKGVEFLFLDLPSKEITELV